MRRRILPILMRPTSMIDKAEKLGLMGRNKLEKYVADNAEIFAAYFADAFTSDEYMFIRDEYDYNDEVEAATDSQNDLDEEQREGREALTAVKAQGFVEFAKKAQEQTGIDMSKLIEEAQFAVGGNPVEGTEDHMKVDEKKNFFYIDGSKAFLMRYGKSAATIRKLLSDYYGPSVRKFHQRMFSIALGQSKKNAENKADKK